ncbi:hypothetical protein [Paenibacillus dendritiformis]|uniref:Macro domain-containing protein n=1 Tax=Paenibacillus dendritiformis C454 TaxID=1131935 RepID=H3SNE2_9BACL|nr:hypothetical protein [Paenibacillus dendritiformis]EHQ59406.1 hypothetical protein PDENDC454_25461 [Paenibacillus dendritiformis C454]CAH8772040.1 hypothetical protein H7S4_004777 [Paenibacillus dendritiformis]
MCALWSWVRSDKMREDAIETGMRCFERFIYCVVCRPGIAVEFKKRFKLASLQETAKHSPLKIGTCYKVGRALNLVTKAKYWHKPTYESLTQAVVSMRVVCLEEGITALAMPQIGCGLDKLQWGRVREMIKDVFADTDIEIVVCTL